jgi:hypothetical protein
MSPIRSRARCAAEFGGANKELRRLTTLMRDHDQGEPTKTRGRLKIGYDWNAITIIALSTLYSLPVSRRTRGRPDRDNWSTPQCDTCSPHAAGEARTASILKDSRAVFNIAGKPTDER